ncbi:MAG: tripartite tricarboxylate transporter substrate binding protein [Zetaproteobacteria bacterium]|jgi:tripartite-type tricarboxylate transporter receptor subunit TctC|nr:MAG: tripartite tricarboxylate transporter substrate binding protein [Zetaproteobacteria bacterium]
MKPEKRPGLVTVWIAAVALAIAWGGNALAGEFPTKAINFITGYTAGSSGDVVFRPLAEAASKTLGQPIVIQNRPGAATALSLAQLMNEKPDGYTIGFMVGSSVLQPHLEKLPYNVIRDFTPIIKFADFVMGVVVHASSPWKTWPEFAAYAKANPGKIKYAHAGAVNRFSMEGFAKEAGLSWVPVTYKGSAEAIVAILGKHVDAFAGGSDFAPYVASGELRLLVTYGRTRYSVYPDTPTFRDLGYKTWMASPCVVVAPKGTPAPIVNKLHDAFKQAMDDAAFKRTLANLNMNMGYAGPADAAKFISDLDELYAGFVKDIGVK